MVVLLSRLQLPVSFYQDANSLWQPSWNEPEFGCPNQRSCSEKFLSKVPSLRSHGCNQVSRLTAQNIFFIIETISFTSLDVQGQSFYLMNPVSASGMQASSSSLGTLSHWKGYSGAMLDLSHLNVWETLDNSRTLECKKFKYQF